MSVDTATRSVDWLSQQGMVEDTLGIAWHAGEPLAVPREWYAEAMASIDSLGLDLDIRYCIQTNAILIDSLWCEFFREYNIQIGVSIDGPAELNDRNRRTRRGGGTHVATMRGISQLRQHGIPFHVISVVTADTITLGADRFADFMLELGAIEVGLNFEELEGVNKSTSLADAEIYVEVHRFLARLMARAADDERLKLREMRGVVSSLRHPNFGKQSRNSENQPFEIVTVDIDGYIYTYSPELAGQESKKYLDFCLGSIYFDKLSSIVSREPFLSMERDIVQGVRRCKSICEYYSLCLGGAPSNKFSELGTFAGTETIACRYHKKAVTEAVLLRLETDLAKD